MIFVLSLDNPIPGKSSALGIRAWQLFRLCQEKAGVKNVKLLVSTSIKGKLPWEHIIRYEFPNDKKPYFDFEHFIKKEDTLIVPINSYKYKILASDCNLVVDLFAPILAEQMFSDVPDIIRVENKKRICKLMMNGDCFLTGYNKQYWQGIFDAYGVGFNNMNKVPLYLPFDGNPRLKYDNNNLIVCMLGTYNSWTDMDATFELIGRFPKQYKFLFKGIGHRIFKRQDKSLGEYVINEYVKAMPKKDRSRIIMDTSWDNKVIKCNAMIYITKLNECMVSSKTRIIDAISQKVPVIVAPEDNIYNIFAGKPEYDLINNYKEDIRDILHYIDNRSSTEACTTSYSFDEVSNTSMGWLE